MQVGENVQLQMKCLGGLKSKPQNLKNLLAVISCGISYNRLSKWSSQVPICTNLRPCLLWWSRLSPEDWKNVLNAAQKLLLRATKIMDTDWEG